MKRKLKVYILARQNKLCLFTDEMIIYIEDPKESTEKTSGTNKLISEDSQVVGYKVNIQKSIPFLYTSNEQVKLEIKNSMSFTLASSKMKYV